MTSVSYVYKVSVQQKHVKMTIPIAIAKLLDITAEDKICFRVGTDSRGTSHVEARFKLKNRTIQQPHVHSYSFQTDACANIRMIANSYYVTVPSHIRAHHTFRKGDLFRWTAEITHDREIGNVEIQYIPKKTRMIHDETFIKQ